LQKGLTRAHLYSVSFINRITGLASGDRGRVLRTNDGGRHWKEVVRLGSQPFTGVTFITAKRAIAVGYAGRVILSVDAALTWEPVDVGMTNDLLSVYFSDHQHGWITGSSGVVLSTAN